MRKISGVLALLIAMCMIVAISGCNVGFSRKGKDVTDEQVFEFTLLGDNTYSVKAKDASSLSGHLTLPTTYNGVQVTVVGYEGFVGANITKLSIPAGYTEIKGYAFSGCVNLSSIEFPSTIKVLGSGSFEGCTSLLNTILLPNGLERLESRCFALCTSLLAIDIPATVSFIGNNCFAEDEDLAINISFANPYYKVENGEIVAKSN